MRNDGAGASLQRIQSGAYGNDPVNWLAATPTPGTHGVSGTPPMITTQPASRTNSVTSLAAFSVTATGTAPLRYQWRANGGNLDGATNATLVLPNVQIADAGTYQAVVFNSAGSTDSSNALFVVRFGPSITNQPTNIFVRVAPDPLGFPTNRATFSAGGVSYNPPLGYQWRFNGADIPGATNSILSFSNVTVANEGVYSALLSDSAGFTPTASARLIPMITPQILLAPLSQTVAAGGRVGVSVAIVGSPAPFGYQWRSNNSASFNFPFVSDLRANYFEFTAQTNLATASWRIVITNAAFVSPGANTTFTVTTIADTDGDGMPDSFELANGGSATGLNPAGDADGDGMSNLAEYLAGTDPSDPNSYLRIEVAAVPGVATVQFGAISNRTYSVQYSDAIPAVGPWSKLADYPARTNNRVESFIDPAWTTNRFYRAVTPRQP